MTARSRNTSSDTLSLHCLMPAEWERHEATWMAWPHYKGDWPGKFEPIPWVYAEIIRYLSRQERVELIVNNAVSENGARKILTQANALNKNVRFHRWPTNRVWTRDSGCTFVKCGAGALAREAQKRHGLSRERHDFSGEDHDLNRKGHDSGRKRHDVAREGHDSGRADATEKDGVLAPENLAAITWRFNAWAKYSNYRHDEKIGSLMAKTANARAIQPVFGKNPVVLEGGSIDVNGKGTLLTTEECLLSKVQRRNPGMSRSDYEQLFAQYLGINNVIWLASGIVGDDTHGHVDDITRFVAPDTVVTAVESDPNDPNYEPLRENIRRLRSATDQNGKSLAIVELPMPSPVIFEKRRLPASYANFYIANDVVLVPVFNDPNDRVALDIVADLFPDCEVVGIYSGDLIWGFGAMHCMTQQQPALSI
ncbi:MAG TPA: agmatine deiminase family protein [Terriglobales bacterium]|nr:agmatine deiminase family protein [Terriglobales bacterium]